MCRNVTTKNNISLTSVFTRRDLKNFSGIKNAGAFLFRRIVSKAVYIILWINSLVQTCMVEAPLFCQSAYGTAVKETSSNAGFSVE